ncbi:MAG: hypothetical protein H6707_20685 [Deltaproteobacteria bacterium]|nr:hypothetical protein [Deltaproteobacteria bacterium]
MKHRTSTSRITRIVALGALLCFAGLANGQRRPRPAHDAEFVFDPTAATHLRVNVERRYDGGSTGRRLLDVRTIERVKRSAPDSSERGVDARHFAAYVPRNGTYYLKQAFDPATGAEINWYREWTANGVRFAYAVRSDGKRSRTITTPAYTRYDQEGQLPYLIAGKAFDLVPFARWLGRQRTALFLYKDHRSVKVVPGQSAQEIAAALSTQR